MKEIQNADWRVVVDEAEGVVYLYVSGSTEALLVTTKEKFASMGALIEQTRRIG